MLSEAIVSSRRPAASIEEIGDRVRRIETKLTSYFASIGFETRAQPPLWHDDGVVSIPSMDCSVKDILASVPVNHTWDQDSVVEVYHKLQHVLCFFLPEKE